MPAPLTVVGIAIAASLKANDSCTPLEVPRNAYLSSSGTSWYCDRGYRKEEKGCVSVKVPANAYLDDGDFGVGWRCDRGYRSSGGACIAVAVPANAFLAESTFYGKDWECNRGYRAENASCVPVRVPPNGSPRTNGGRLEMRSGIRPKRRNLRGGNGTRTRVSQYVR